VEITSSHRQVIGSRVVWCTTVESSEYEDDLRFFLPRVERKLAIFVYKTAVALAVPSDTLNHYYGHNENSVFHTYILNMKADERRL